MKRIKKFILILFGTIGLLGILFAVGFVYYLETSINDFVEEENLTDFYYSINNSPELPQIFYDTYDKYNIDLLEQGVWSSFINQIIPLKGITKCQCREIYPLYIKGKRQDHGFLNRFSGLILELDIEENCTQQKCFEYHMYITKFGENTRGVEPAACHFFNKELTELNDREILGFLMMQKAPFYYNPISNPENWNEAVDNLMRKESTQSDK